MYITMNVYINLYIVQHHRILLYKYGAIEFNKHLHLHTCVKKRVYSGFEDTSSAVGWRVLADVRALTSSRVGGTNWHLAPTAFYLDCQLNTALVAWLVCV